MKEYNYNIGDVVEMKKPHPCVHRSKIFKIIKLGADLKIECMGCHNIIVISRDSFNKGFKKIIK